MIVARTKGYTHAAKVWDSSIVEGPFPPRAKPLIVRFATFASLYPGQMSRRRLRM
jgi:hypothetical protein